MERIPELDTNLLEQEVREEQHKLLESLSGFPHLSEDQQRYIKATLYIQQRAERESDPVSASRVKSMPQVFESNAPGRPYIDHSSLSTQVSSDKGGYFESQLYIMNQYCHAAVAKLEDYRENKESAKNWREAGPIHSFLELVELLELARAEHDFPFVIEVRHRPLGEDRSALEHSTVLLGQNVDGEFMVWEKSGYHLPFQLVPLRQVFDAYKGSTGWRLRPVLV
jgi:hypothetical protein